ALSADGSQQIRGGVGLFAGRTPYVWISNQFGNNGIDFTRLSVSLNANNKIPFISDGTAQPTSLVGVGAATNESDLIDPNFKYPSVVRSNLAWDFSLPGGWFGTIEGLYTKTMEDVKYQNLNYKVTGALNLDGRPTFTKVVSSLSDVLLLTNTTQGNSY